ncbi:MAG: hypothetical protein KAR35_06570 [Candidatus Heimdallarchaeota archaeon]|nr:hypothetical protein [Candidatus Heimdallarchaeota archaeon]MCK5049022.1 hypothetical protein [Candidatus Heimdallarchaeota archaeon]
MVDFDTRSLGMMAPGVGAAALAVFNFLTMRKGAVIVPGKVSTYGLMLENFTPIRRAFYFPVPLYNKGIEQGVVSNVEFILNTANGDIVFPVEDRVEMKSIAQKVGSASFSPEDPSINVIPTFPMLIRPKEGLVAIFKCVDPLKDSKEYIIPTDEHITITIKVTYNEDKTSAIIVPFHREKTTQPFGLVRWYRL